jgi:hypothetical protein
LAIPIKAKMHSISIPRSVSNRNVYCVLSVCVHKNVSSTIIRDSLYCK